MTGNRAQGGLRRAPHRAVRVAHEEERLLARRVLKGDRAALRVFFDTHYPATYRYCLRRVSPQDAEELATDALRHAIRRLQDYRGEARLLTWIHGIARNLLASHFRRTARHREVVYIDANERVRAQVESMTADERESPEYAQELRERQHLVHLMLDRLPLDYGQLLEWKYIEGKSVEEIAARLETTAISVQSRLARARKSFRQSMAGLEHELAQPLTVPGFAAGEYP